MVVAKSVGVIVGTSTPGDLLIIYLRFAGNGTLAMITRLKKAFIAGREN
jgi:hypothetical protein